MTSETFEETWVKLIVASWILLVPALICPALTELGIPNWALVGISVVALFGPDGLAPPQLLLVGLVCFILTTSILWWRPRSVFGIAGFAAILSGLLVVWVVPPLGGIADHVGAVAGFREFRWGYYFYASVHVLMFVAGGMALISQRPARHKRGFPVTIPNGHGYGVRDEKTQN